MPPQEVDRVMSAIQVNGEPRDDFIETDDAALHRDADAPFHMLLESIKASTTLPPQPSVTTFQAPSGKGLACLVSQDPNYPQSAVLGDYAPSETTTDTDTMVTWQPAESEPLVESYKAPVVEDERPDTPVGPRIDVHHHQPQGFETPQRQTLPSER
ncbi:hypothetical protein FRC00_013494 [Tulasnella sp. 408]|nr:hypothetical protein FRC00_013494 [Tulasnella sp. 408]